MEPFLTVAQWESWASIHGWLKVHYREGHWVYVTPAGILVGVMHKDGYITDLGNYSS